MKKITSNSMDGINAKPRFRKAALLLAFSIAIGIGVASAQAPQIFKAGDKSGQTNINERNPGTGGPVRNVNQIQICPVIGNIQMVDMGFDKALISWSNLTSFDSIVFRTTNMSNGLVRIIAIPGNPNPGRYFLLGLMSHTIYQIEASTVCSGIQSAWSAPITVTTLAPRTVGGQISIGSQIYINPNPATTQVLVSFKSDINTSQSVVITNMTGQIVYSKTLIATSEKVQLSVDVSAFPNGIYYVRLTNNRGVSTERMIVQ